MLHRIFIPACVFGLLAVQAGTVNGQAPPPDTQILGAIQAAPEAARQGAGVLGYDGTGKLITLRQGQNEVLCLADDPSVEEFSVACYHRSLEPYMARGRELSAQGIQGEERYAIRWREAEEGTLDMPDAPATLYVLTGSSFDSATGKVADAYLRYVIYTPWATLESTGLPDRPSGPGSPWLMFPGTAGAHIMISPPPAGSGSRR